MHLPTHILSGWCVGNCFRINARQRLGCMIAATIADLDGVTLICGPGFFERTHHVLGHNFGWSILSSLILAWFTGRRLLIFLLYLFCFHLHLALDYYGSGFGWPILYLWPFSLARYRSVNGWDLYSWQNYLALGSFFILTLVIAALFRRTPLELIAPRWDRALTDRKIGPA